MRRARATFCGRRRNIATTSDGCVPYPEATVRYGREKCQDTTLRPRVPPLSNVPDRRELRERRRLRRVARRRPSRALTKSAPPHLQTFNVTSWSRWTLLTHVTQYSFSISPYLCISTYYISLPLPHHASAHRSIIIML